jgi:hypothetical protein
MARGYWVVDTTLTVPGGFRPGSQDFQRPERNACPACSDRETSGTRVPRTILAVKSLTRKSR